jgi:hypothetical protein
MTGEFLFPFVVDEFDLVTSPISLAYDQPRIRVPEYYTLRGKLREPHQ